MKRKGLHAIGWAAGIMLAVSTGIGTWTVSATTVADVIGHAYAVGLPEDIIQQCINQYSGGEYTSEECDAAIAALDEWAASRDNAIEDVLEEELSESSTETSTASDPVSESSAESSELEDGEFVKMTLEEKISYVNGLPSDERTEFIQNMTTEERNSFLKQMDTADQAAVISELMGVGDAFGLSFSVDTLSDDRIVISSRDADGNLVNVSTFGETVEETGVSYTAPILIGGGAVLLAGAGLGLLLYRTVRREEKRGES